MNYKSIKELISNIKNHESVNEDWFNESTEEAIVAFALRFLASNLNDEEVVEYLKDSLA
tara:strand:- start:290 stop:466 length:177 start_codon:yes stop_codon:yes gene_type:complete